ncbi:hypothetical protein MNBD_CHLOROFLEXI01-2366 [hydrothermal vent metagenome]|uniref:Uncharacterized protein n=1 Tax=hydrothermal vent metagenome TaxID=652676 RepID=A0A3B0W2L9_9ZZZZ
MKKISTLLPLIIIAAVLLGASAQATMAQTEPEVTPEGGYPPPATPVQQEDTLEEAYPSELSRPPASAPEAGYITPTSAPSQPANNTVTVIGEEDSAATAVPSLPISQSSLVRNQAILWAGFLITLLIFFTAVYGAMLMYRRRR